MAWYLSDKQYIGLVETCAVCFIPLAAASSVLHRPSTGIYQAPPFEKQSHARCGGMHKLCEIEVI
ncbi:hypothetical protein BO70DRAFT_357837, partial [Aspergillus heteromorphus CBS 117.55]